MSATTTPAGVPDVLVKIVGRRRERYAGAGEAATAERAELLSARKRFSSTDSSSARSAVAENRFLAALGAERPGRAAVIAEVKMGSPRIGSLVGRVDPEAQATVYAKGGAAALSVVVEPDFFHGSYELLARAKGACGLPAIAKDFVVSGRQLEEAAAAGADAILLIAALYEPDDLARWARRARALGLVPLVETHGGDDQEKVARAADGWELVGINNRDLRTFEVDLEHSIERLPHLPADAFHVAESGIRDGADVRRLHEAGFDAFLIGESLLLAEDPAAKLRDLVTMGAG
ncbi:MAG TPA: indole-3-glycerol-phosphate synthase [Thermoanaerobaculia bacterium]|nr:indole-3-glycerol-phosphate synthase [Thermoanaerobaculia bacterium]